MAATELRIGAVRGPADVRVVEADGEGRTRGVALEALAPEQAFLPHPGWSGHLEARRCAG
jgi:hypothetical protein